MLKKPRVAIIGAGYAGMAAAVELASHSIPVTVFEAARTLGGRARRVEKNGVTLDNGQHILIGAYSELLRLLDVVGHTQNNNNNSNSNNNTNTKNKQEAVLKRLPLTLNFPGAMSLAAPRLPAPLHMAYALLTARGLPLRACLSAIRFMRALQASQFQLNHEQANFLTVSALLDQHQQPSVLRDYLWHPLCVSALNTAPDVASAQVFLNVLRDSLSARREASDLLLPRVDLSAFFPEPAAQFVEAHGGKVIRGGTIQSIQQVLGEVSKVGESGTFQLTRTQTEQGDLPNFTHVIAAVAPFHLPKLVANLPELADSVCAVEQFQYEPILTCYLRYAQPITFPAPMVGIAGGTAHFLFQRDEFHANTAESAGLIAAVISAGGPHQLLSREALVEKVHEEIKQIVEKGDNGDNEKKSFKSLSPPIWSQIITEKRATFACLPGMKRPSSKTPLKNFFLAGDYVASDYPATLESAARSGVACAQLILEEQASSQ